MRCRAALQLDLGRLFRPSHSWASRSIVLFVPKQAGAGSLRWAARSGARSRGRPARRGLLRAMFRAEAAAGPLIALRAILGVAHRQRWVSSICRFSSATTFAAEMVPAALRGAPTISYLALAVPLGRLSDRIGKPKVVDRRACSHLIATYCSDGAAARRYPVDGRQPAALRHPTTPRTDGVLPRAGQPAHPGRGAWHRHRRRPKPWSRWPGAGLVPSCSAA